MASPAIVQDGSAPYSSPILTINGIAYKTNNFNIERPVAKAIRNSNDGRPSDQRWTAQVATATGELQSNTGVADPVFGDEFTLTIAGSGFGSENWVITTVGTTMTNSDTEMRVTPFTAEKRINNTAVTKIF